MGQEGEDGLRPGQRQLFHPPVVALERKAALARPLLQPLPLAHELRGVPVLPPLDGEGLEADELAEVGDHPLAIAGEGIAPQQAGGEPGVGGTHRGRGAQAGDPRAQIPGSGRARRPGGGLLEGVERLASRSVRPRQRAGGGREIGVGLLAAGRLLGRQREGGGDQEQTQERQGADLQGSSHGDLRKRLLRDLLSQGREKPRKD